MLTLLFCLNATLTALFLTVKNCKSNIIIIDKVIVVKLSKDEIVIKKKLHIQYIISDNTNYINAYVFVKVFK